MEKKIKIQIPSVPNFIMAEGNDAKFHISDFTEKELKEIGARWTKELIAKSKKGPKGLYMDEEDTDWDD